MKNVFLLFSLMLITGVFIKAQTVDVTFQVDVSIEIATETFNPATNQVEIRGDFDGWGAGLVLSDADNDSVYTVTMVGQPQNTTIFYKFFHTGNMGTWESDPNREVNTGTSSTLDLDPFFFDDRTPYTGIPTNVTFNVDMRIPAQGDFDPTTDTVFVAGSFTDWGTGAVMMEDLDGDSTYTVAIDTLTSGDLLFYKFIFIASGATTWESPTEGDDIDVASGNRIFGPADSNNVITRFWNNVDPDVTQLADGNIFFEVDMSVATELGVFDFNVDSVQIRGVFNGWDDSQPERSLMNQNPADPNNWFLDIPMVQLPLNSTLAYKYFITSGPGSTPYANGGWEVAIGNTITSDRNRPVIFEGSGIQEVPLAYLGNIHPDWVIPTGTTVECEFIVDMTFATIADTQGTSPVFIPGTDSVFWIPRQPFYYAINGLEWPGEYPRILQLTDPDQDMIYTGTLTINGPAFNGFLYNYAYTSTSGLILEEGSQQDVRVRFMSQSGPRAINSPFTMPLDIWSNSPKPEELEPVIITSVKEIAGIPNVYSLEQNYPNPFNPATLIRFSIPEQGLVTLKVFNLLGEEIATLLNSELTNGTYEVDFNGANYSSGIYFYTIKANNYFATKKMILLK
ncbi:MAG: T9SS type A sorting domain-containing protein [Bacteroidetes bacterium]|nr:T9SS type A sorting domain-containing protein [Bacteroidota bacterium]